MEIDGRRLAWIAIGLSALALVVSLSGAARPQFVMGYGPPGQQSAPWAGPPHEQGRGPMWHPEQGRGPEGFSEQGRGPGWHPGQGPDGMAPRPELQVEQFQRREFGGPSHAGPFGMFFAPFRIVSGLARLALLALLVVVVLRWLGRRRGASTGPGPGAHASRPGPEQPPYPEEG